MRQGEIDDSSRNSTHFEAEVGRGRKHQRAAEVSYTAWNRKLRGRQKPEAPMGGGGELRWCVKARRGDYV